MNALKIVICLLLLASLYSGCSDSEPQKLRELSEQEMVLLFFEQEKELFHDIIDLHGGADIYIGLNEDEYYEPGTPFECYLHGENGENENSRKGRKCRALVNEITEEADNLFNQYYGESNRALVDVSSNGIQPGTDFNFFSHTLNHGIKYHTGKPTAYEEEVEEKWYYYSYPVISGEDAATAYFIENREKFERVLEYYCGQPYEFCFLGRTLINPEGEIFYELRQEGVVVDIDMDSEIIQAFADLDAAIGSISYQYYEETDEDFCEFAFINSGKWHGIVYIEDTELSGYEKKIVDNWYYFNYPKE